MKLKIHIYIYIYRNTALLVSLRSEVQMFLMVYFDLVFCACVSVSVGVGGDLVPSFFWALVHVAPFFCTDKASKKKKKRKRAKLCKILCL